MEISRYLRQHARTIAGKSQLFINSYAKALEVIFMRKYAQIYTFPHARKIIGWSSLIFLTISCGNRTHQLYYHHMLHSKPLFIALPRYCVTILEYESKYWWQEGIYFIAGFLFSIWFLAYGYYLCRVHLPSIMRLNAYRCLCFYLCGGYNLSNMLSDSVFAGLLQVIPRQLCDNAGFDATDVLNKLRQKHALPSG